MASVNDFEDVSLELGKLESTLDALQREHHDVTDQVDNTESEISGLEKRLDSVEGHVQKLASQLASVQRHVITSGTETRADLDTWSSTEQAWARSAVRGIELETRMLTDEARHTKRADLKQAEVALQQHADNEDALVAAARDLAELSDRNPQAAQYTRAAKTYQSARRAVLADRRRTDVLAGQIETVRAELAADEKFCRKHGAELQTCRIEQQKLRTRIRQRLASAVDSGAALPVWFSTVLGHAPPARNTEHWVNTAVGVLAFRALYGVSDQILALGPELDRDTVEQSRRTLRNELAKTLQDYGTSGV